MTDQILEYFGKSHASHIHARGKVSTIKLIELLEVKGSEKILEIGFGTGATLVQIAARSKADFFGYETSKVMFQKALKRIRFCKMRERINLTLIEKKNQFPVPDSTFDRVYCESIIAIQEDDDFLNLLLEIKRVLKPNGILLFNETIWLDNTKKSEAQKINSECKKSLGIIQSNHDYLHVIDWKNVLEKIGFKQELEMRVADIPTLKGKVSRFTFLSKIFTLTGKTKALTSVSMRRNWKSFQLEIDSIMKNQEKLMEGVIIKAYNNK
ncbi:class I SAM-dependent methyltransferase [Crocinitomicaceae bacterium]|nr:class I SAM-dependent methyltransferase [Crocinitomicaceae bacterium]